MQQRFYTVNSNGDISCNKYVSFYKHISFFYFSGEEFGQYFLYFNTLDVFVMIGHAKIGGPLASGNERYIIVFITNCDLSVRTKAYIFF